MRDLIVEFFVPRVDESKVEGKRMLRLICDIAPELMPEFYNTYEPVNKRFNLAELDVALEEWHFSFLWKRKKPPVTGVIFLGSAQKERPTHTHVVIRAKPEIIGGKRLIYFMEKFAKAFLVDVALAHVLTKQEIEIKRFFMLSTHILKESLPNIYWITVFGAPYVKLFGRERLLSTPVPAAKELSEDLILIQLTNDVMDTRKDPESVEVARAAVKNHLDSNAFFDPQRSPNYVYRRPEFYIKNTTPFNR